MTEEHQQIEAFLEGRLSQIEQAQVQKRITEDQRFREMVDEEQRLRSVVSDTESQFFLRKVRGVIEEKKNQHKSRVRSFVLSIAAVMLVLLGVFFIWYPNPEPRDVFTEYFEPYPMILAQRNQQDAAITTLIEDYEQRRWGRVEGDLLALPENTLSKSRVDLYLGIAALGQQLPAKAIAILEPYAKHRVNDLDQEMLDWYLVLAYLANDDAIVAKTYLNKLLQTLPGGQLRSRCLKLAKDL